MNKASMKIFDNIKKDPRVSTIWDEDEDGIWVDLKPGWQDANFDQYCHTIHEWNIREVFERFKSISPCNCQECTELIKN